MKQLVLLASFFILPLMSLAAPSYCPEDLNFEILEREVNDQELDKNSESKTLLIGTKFSPPFVMGEISQLDGLSIRLWGLLADCLALTENQFTFVEYGTTEDLILAVNAGEIDLAIAAISVNADREKLIDFSHPYFEASLGAMVASRDSGANFALVVAKILKSNLLNIILGLLGFMIFVAIYYWWTERQKGNEFFSEGPFKGFYRALIWSTLLVFQGKGDPFTLNTRFGQLFVLFLMFFGVTIISSFTAVITSSLTIQALEPQISTIDDLSGKTVAVKNLSFAADWADEQGIFVEQQQTFPQVQRKFDEAQIDVFVHDRDILKYLVNTKALVDVKLSPLSVAPQHYSIVMGTNSPYEESINLSLLTILEDPIWQSTFEHFLGKNE